MVFYLRCLFKSFVYVINKFVFRITSLDSVVMDDLVESIMSPNPYCVEENQLVQQVLGEMAENNLDYAIVIDKYGQVVGIFESQTISDAIAHNEEENLLSSPIGNYVHNLFHRISPKDTILDAAKKIDNLRLHYLVVIVGITPVGIVSHTSLIRWLVNRNDSSG